MCKYNLNENSIELFGIRIWTDDTSFKILDMRMKSICGGKSMSMYEGNNVSVDSFAFTGPNYDYVTITYKDSNGAETGVLKIMTGDEFMSKVGPSRITGGFTMNGGKNTLYCDGGEMLLLAPSGSDYFNEKINGSNARVTKISKAHRLIYHAITK